LGRTKTEIEKNKKDIKSFGQLELKSKEKLLFSQSSGLPTNCPEGKEL
jgi:hypothetical protein